MRIRKFTALLLALCMMTALLPAGLLTGNADGVYTVTLDPGVAGGEPVVYRSDAQAVIPRRSDAQNCQFFYHEDGGMGFYLSNDYCPDSFSPQNYYAFLGWQDYSTPYNRLTSFAVTYRARWKRISAGFELGLSSNLLPGAGYTPLTVTADVLTEGFIHNATGTGVVYTTGLSVQVYGGSLTCGDSEIPFGVYEDDLSGDGLTVEGSIFEQGEEIPLNIYIDPDVYDSSPGEDYSGTLNYTTQWYTQEGFIDGPDGSFDLFLTMPADYTVTFDAQGGSVEPAVMTTVNDMLPSLPTPECAGKVFIGWFSGNVGGNRITTDTVFDSDKTVYAHWFDPDEIVFDMPQSLTIAGSGFTALTADISTLVFTEQPNGETPYMLRVIFTAGALTNADGIATIPYKMGYIESVNALSNQLYKDWTAAGNPQTIYLYVSDADLEAAGPGVYTGEVRYTARWSFEHGWSSDMLTWTVPLSLTVVEQVYTVSFDAQGGTVDPAEMTTSLYKLPSLPTPERENREFLGWFTEAEGGEEITADTVFRADTEVFAHWRVPNGFILDLPEVVTLTDSLWNEMQVDIEALEFYEQPNGKTPYRMRVIFTAGTLTNADGTVTIPYKLNVEEDPEWVSNQKMRDWTAAGNPRTIYIYMSDADRAAAGYGVFTGTMTYIARWGFENNGWSGDILTGTIPVTLTIPGETVSFDVNSDGTVNISDVTALLDHLAASNANDLSHDLNDDGLVNITDVTALLDHLSENS